MFGSLNVKRKTSGPLRLKLYKGGKAVICKNTKVTFELCVRMKRMVTQFHVLQWFHLLTTVLILFSINILVHMQTLYLTGVNKVNVGSFIELL